jgi:hypothetical protein
MPLSPWIIKTALVLGLSGIACLIWGLFNNHKMAVRLGHLIVGLHMFMYFLGSGGQWLIGLGTLSFTIAGFVYPLEFVGYKRGLIWLALALPLGVAYLFTMGLFTLVLVTGGM